MAIKKKTKKKNKLKKEKDLPFFEKEISIQIVFRKKDIQHTTHTHTQRERDRIFHTWSKGMSRIKK